MLNVILHGCFGAMGRVVSSLAAEDESVNIVAGIDVAGGTDPGFPVFKTPAECDVTADAIIDFCVAQAVDDIVSYAVSRKIPLVLCTTGLSEEQLESVRKASEQVAILRSANMSVGVNAIFKIAAMAAQILADRGFDIEIAEKHHNRKLDAPSGTALAIADAINDAMDGRYSYRLDRSSVREKRKPDEIGIQAIRGGSIVGEHEIFYCGTDEVIEIKHTAYSRAIFGKGAIAAAAYLKDKGPGLYNMSDVLE